MARWRMHWHMGCTQRLFTMNDLFTMNEQWEETQ